MQPEETVPPFDPAPALGHRHVQTFWGRLTRPRLLVPLRRESLPTPDGDELVLDHLDGPAGAPRVFLLHGLEGSAHSVYVQGLLALLEERGLRAVALNFRSCARDLPDLGRNIPNRARAPLPLGRDDRLRPPREGPSSPAEPGVPHAAIGVSLGGNVLLKWLGENPGQAPPRRGRDDLGPLRPRGGRPEAREGARPRLHGDVPARPAGGRRDSSCSRHPEAASRFDVAQDASRPGPSSSSTTR